MNVRWLLAALVMPAAVAAQAATPFNVSIKVDASQLKGELKPIYRFFGADEPNYATMKDGRKLIAELGTLGAPQVFFRTHKPPGPDANISLSVTGLPSSATNARITEYRIDETHSNSYAAWKRIGSPTAPTRRQYNELDAAGQLAPVSAPSNVRLDRGLASFTIALTRQAVSLFVIEWEQ
jgi:hypothetical protein